MKLYHTPLSTHCRPITAFLAEAGIPCERVAIDLQKGEHHAPGFLALNPSAAVPVLVDGDFVLTESSAILKYLADKVESPLYPRDPRARARVNERMDWFNTGFEHHMAFELVYPQVLPHHRRPTPELNQATVDWGLARTQAALATLDAHLIGPSGWVAGDAMSIADLLGASFASLPRIFGTTFRDYPRVVAWLERIESRPAWKEASVAFDGLGRALAGGNFTTIP